MTDGAKTALKITEEDSKLEVVDVVNSGKKKAINFFECNHATLLTDGASIFDGRVLLEIDTSRELPEKLPKETKFILLCIRVKFSDGESKVAYSWDSLYNPKNMKKIQQHYAKKNTFLIPAYILNRELSSEKPKNVVVITRKEVPLLLPEFEHFYLSTQKNF